MSDLRAGVGRVNEGDSVDVNQEGSLASRNYCQTYHIVTREGCSCNVFLVVPCRRMCQPNVDSYHDGF